HQLAKWKRPSIAQEAVRPCRPGSSFTTVIRGQTAVSLTVIHSEPSTADSRRLGLGEVQDKLGRDGRIHGAATFLEHLITGLGSQGVRGYHHEMFCANQRFFCIAASALGIEVLDRKGVVEG